MVLISFMASEEMSFENVDRQTMTDVCLYYKLTYTLQPGELKISGKVTKIKCRIKSKPHAHLQTMEKKMCKAA